MLSCRGEKMNCKNETHTAQTVYFLSQYTFNIQYSCCDFFFEKANRNKPYQQVQQ